MALTKMVDGVEVELTPDEEAAVRAEWAANDLAAVRNGILSQIARAEAQITPRRLREAVLDQSAQAWLAARDAEIAALRAQL